MSWEDVHYSLSGPRSTSLNDGNHDSNVETRSQVDNGFVESEEETEEKEDQRLASIKQRRKLGGYDSRIEQILDENPDLPILIVDAGKSLESGSRYIVYTIRTGVCRSIIGRGSLLTTAGPGSPTKIFRICITS